VALRLPQDIETTQPLASMALLVFTPHLMRSKSLIITAFVALGSTVLDAQQIGRTGMKSTDQPASAGLLNDYFRKESSSYNAWDLGIQVRMRYEIYDNGGTFPNRDFQAHGVDNDNAYFLLREKIHLGYRSKWISAFVEGRDASSSGDDHPANPNTDTFDLHQAYLILGSTNVFPLSLKVGRQELIYGDERLIGASDWTNTGRTFDAAKLRFENSYLWVDLFGSRVVINDDHNFNVVDDYDWFSGLYASTRTIIPKNEAQVYVLSRNTSVGGLVSPRDIYTAGIRLKSLPGQFNGFDYSLEGAGQLGSMNVNGTRLNHEALAGTVTGGYTWSKTMSTPRVSLEYNYATGDHDPNDNKNGTFENLFPTNHKPYGTMDFIGWRNIHDVRGGVSIWGSKKLFLSGDYHAFFLADTADYFFPQSGPGRSTNGYGRNSSYSSFLGTEADLELLYNVNSYSNFKAGYGHFFIGDYINQSKAIVGGAKDADWCYVQLTFNF
jgi:hypothetical protein